MKNNTISSIIRQIVDAQGIDILLDSSRFRAYLYDLYVDSPQIRNIFQRAVDDTVLRKFHAVYLAEAPKRGELLNKIRYYLTGDLGFAADWADTVICAFSDAFGWTQPPAAPAKSPPAPAARAKSPAASAAPVTPPKQPSQPPAKPAPPAVTRRPIPKRKLSGLLVALEVVAIIAILALLITGRTLSEEEPDLQIMPKTFSGTYTSNRLHGFDLEILSSDPEGNITALFSFYSTDPGDNLFGSFDMEGSLISVQDDGSLVFSMTGTAWRVRPGTYSMINFPLTVNPEKTVIRSDDYELYGVDTAVGGLYRHDDILKTYSGTYVPNWGVTNLDLQITSCDPDTGEVEAVFHFYPHAHNPDISTGSFLMSGQIFHVYSDGSLKIALTGKEWIDEPPNTVMLDFSITINPLRTEAISGDYQINLRALP